MNIVFGLVKLQLSLPINIEIGSLTPIGTHKTLIYSPYANNNVGINILGLLINYLRPF